MARNTIKSEFLTSKMADRFEMASKAIESDLMRMLMTMMNI